MSSYPKHSSTSTTNPNVEPMGDAPTIGAQIGAGLSGMFKDGLHAAENLRHGVNNAADNAIQPAAARDSERGVTAQHKTPYARDGSTGLGHGTAAGPSAGTGTAGMHTGSAGHTTHSSPGFGTTSTATSDTGTTSSGGRAFSGDAKALGLGLKNAVTGNKNQGATGATGTTSSVGSAGGTTTGIMGTRY